MTPNAKKFVAANDRHPVVSASLIEENPNRPHRGSWYTLSNGSAWKLFAEDVRSLPEGYPKWEL